MFHGVAGKYGFDAPNESMRQWDRLFFVNERRLRNFVTSGAIDAGSPAARLIGMPKVDCLVDGSLRQDRVLRQFDLDPARPTVLYAPTWSPASSLNRLGPALVERLMSLPVNVIVKLHDRSRDPRPQYSGGVDWVARLTPLLDRPHGRLATAANITPCLVAADVMISDHSSAAFEYLLLDRPMVRIDVPELIRRANVHPEYVQLLADTADNVKSLDDTVAAVERALADPRARSDTRRRVAGDLFYRPGTAAARCAAALYEVLELTPHSSVAAAATEVAPCLQSA
jgi:CDP-glycerol glycerophosphotransferase (TagB/SpsB family)